MKTTRIFAAAIALLSVLSCQKEEQQAINNSEIEGVNLITCTFAANDAATKTTTTDGKTPLWAAGDEIMLYDGSSQTQKLTLAASGTASSTQGVIDGTDATKFTFAKPDGWTNVYAIYPSSACVSGFSASAPKLNFAGQDGSFGTANICAAAEVSGTMSFENVGAILKFPSKPATVTDIVIPVAGLVKDYTVSFSGDAPTLTPADATNSNSFSIGSGTGVIYIGVPAGEQIAKGSAFVYKDASSIHGCYLTGAANTPVANKIYTLPAIEANGKLPGVFTVGEASGSYTGKVRFSKGNLQATCTTAGAEGTSTYSWAFAEHQYDYVGSAAGNTTIGNQTLTSKVDLFGWVGASSTVLTGEASKYGISTSMTSTDYGNNASDALKADWGTTIDNNGTWRTLSSDEWTYLLNTRTDAYRFAKATVSDVAGLIIFPDGYTHPDGVTVPTKVNESGSLFSSIDFTVNNYTSADWAKMESAGCVFLPAAGRRSGSDVYAAGSEGRYWSATPKPNETSWAYYLCFNSGSVNPTDYLSRIIGHSVRLVCAAQ